MLFYARMWCAHCLQVVGTGIDHSACVNAVWFSMSQEYTRARLAMAKQTDPDVHKGETVELRNFSSLAQYK
jgi:hypothetical protein